MSERDAFVAGAKYAAQEYEDNGMFLVHWAEEESGKRYPATPPGGLREKIDAVILGEFKHDRLSEAAKQHLDDRMETECMKAGEYEVFYVWAMGRLSLARELAAPGTRKEGE